MGNIQTTILNSAKDKDSGGYVPGFNGDGFTALAIIYAVFSLSNWFAPSVVSVIGPRITMVVGGVIYSLYIAQIIYPNVYLLYGGSILIGTGAAVIWTAQGNFLTLNSDPSTMTRNSGVFWAMLQMSMLIGNTFVFFTFQGKTDIDKTTRTTVVLVLLSICICGSLVFFLLRPMCSLFRFGDFWVGYRLPFLTKSQSSHEDRRTYIKDLILIEIVFEILDFTHMPD